MSDIAPAGRAVQASTARTLIFFVTEDWFFASHFLPMLRAAREAGFAPAVICRARAHRGAIEAAGGRVIALNVDRGRRTPGAALALVREVTRILRAEKPAILHLIALWPIALGSIAAVFAGVRRRVYAVTGLGFLAASQAQAQRAARLAMRLALRGPLDGRQVRFLLENPDDAGLLGFDPGSAARLVIVGGAGVDPDVYAPSPLPPMPPLRIAIVARMLWSKGIDVAVEATRLARAEGAPVELSLYGEPDLTNPKTITRAQLEDWSKQDGICWKGRSENVAALWREHHICCLPSRGGEGLPRALLEGASCGRGLLTSDVPGCRTLARDNIEGLLTPPGDTRALASAMAKLARDPALVARLGVAARARILWGFTERHVIDKVAAMYRELGR